MAVVIRSLMGSYLKTCSNYVCVCVYELVLAQCPQEALELPRGGAIAAGALTLSLLSILGNFIFK